MSNSLAITSPAGLPSPFPAGLTSGSAGVVSAVGTQGVADQAGTPYAFEEMDRNKDGILSRFEYEDGVR